MREGASPNMALQRTRRPRLRPGRSLRSLGSPLSRKMLGGKARTSHGAGGTRLWTITIVALLAAFPSSPSAAQTFMEFEIPTLNSRPLSITSGPDGNLWFTELEGNRVGRITPAGVITEFSLPTPNSLPTGITSAHGSIWLTESHGNRVARVLMDGTVQEFSLPKQQLYPGAITTGTDGNPWIAIAGGVGRVNRSGSVVIFDVPGSLEIRGIAPGPASTIWITDSRAGQVSAITLSGKVKRTFPVYRPDKIAAGLNGDMWLTYVDGDGVSRILPTGQVESFQLTRSAPMGLAADRTGTVWVSDWVWNTIIKLTPGGSDSRYSVPTPKGRPAGIVVGPDGCIWFVEGIGNKIGRLCSPT
jgi:streptogramin lyase